MSRSCKWRNLLFLSKQELGMFTAIASWIIPDALILCSKTLQITEASIVSGFGWGLTKRIENHGLAKFKANVQRVHNLTISYHNITDIYIIVSGGSVVDTGSVATVASAAHDDATIP
jgi:hypothetical protein